MRQYDKLVRDNIPAIIKASGGTCECRTASTDEYASKLLQKLVEEACEVASSQNVADIAVELADVSEVMLAIGELYDLTPERIEAIRSTRAAERGRFNDRVILLSS